MKVSTTVGDGESGADWAAGGGEESSDASSPNQVLMLRGQPRNIETSQPMSPKRSFKVSTNWLLQMQGSVMRMRMKPGSIMNLVRGMARVRIRGKVRVGVRVEVGLWLGFG